MTSRGFVIAEATEAEKKEHIKEDLIPISLSMDDLQNCFDFSYTEK